MENKKHALNMTGKQTNNTGFEAVPVKTNVTVDACLEEWDLSGQIQCYADYDRKETFSVKAAAMWDEEYLYLSFVWRDPYPMVSKIHPLQDRTRGWMADSVQLRVLADGQPGWITLWCYDGDKSAVDVVYLAGTDRMKDQENGPLYYTGISGQAELGEGVASAYRLAPDGKGFTQEVRLPWRILYKKEHKAKAGEKIRLGLEFHYGTPGGSGWPMHDYIDNLQPGKSMRAFFWTNVENWGDLILSDHSVEHVREYRMEEGGDKTGIPIRCKVPKDARTFTVVVNTKEGERVRNVAGACRVSEHTVEQEGQDLVVEVYWDGLDEAGNPAAPGEYVAAGITAEGIDGYYESSFYNPGTPAWRTSDSTGGWGGDHTVPHLLCAAGDGMAVSSQFAEGGYGTFLLNMTGEKADRKRWSEIRGSEALAAGEKYVFIVPNDWSASGVELLRMDTQTGKFVPFVRDGKELPMPFPLREVFGLPQGEEPPKVVSMALTADMLLLRCDDHTIRLVNPETGQQGRVYELPEDSEVPGSAFVLDYSTQAKKVYRDMTADTENAYYIVGTQIHRLHLASGQVERNLFGEVERPSALCMDQEGNLYVADAGSAEQIIKFALSGEALLRIGKRGGRALLGKYDRDGLYRPTSVAVDSGGRIWATETGTTPRRISVWSAEGMFLKEFIGNCGYAGQGTFIHTQNPHKAFAEFNEMVQNPETGEWEVDNIMYCPEDPEETGRLMIAPGDTPFDSGSMFYSEASGECHEYFAVLGWPRRTSFFVMMKKGEKWVPVAAMVTVGNLLRLKGGSHDRMIVRKPYGEWEDHDVNDVVFWNDYNNDGYVTMDECVVVPALLEGSSKGLEAPFVWEQKNIPIEVCPSASISTEDLSFYATCRKKGEKPVACLVKPVRFRDGGLPVYLPEGICPVTDAYRMVASPAQIPGKNLTIAFIELDKKIYVAGLRKSDGKILWKYLSPYHEVHGSHHAPVARPGLLIGCLKVAGFAPGCGDCDTIMVRGNMGEDYFLTTDGEYIDRLTHDGRLPGMAFPDSVEELKKISFANFPGRAEHFSGLFTRHSDGVVRCSGGLPACEAGNVIRIEGLEKVRHFPAVCFTLTEEDVRKAQQDREEAGQQESDVKEAICLKYAKDKESFLEQAKTYRIDGKGEDLYGDFRGAYDEDNLYLSYDLYGFSWINGGADYRLLFKTGACVDFQLSLTGNHGAEPVDGDFRLLTAPFGGKNTVVLMAQKKDGEKGESYTYSSPVMSVVFDVVRKLEDAVVEESPIDNGFRIQITVPWKAMGTKMPEKGKELSGDVGFIVPDAAGQTDTARIYYSNKKTNLVSDQPGEAKICPDGFGTVQF